MVLYSRGGWNALFFIGCYWRTDVYKNGRSLALLFYCFGRGTSVARRDQGGGLALPESCRGCCRSRYDAKKKPKSVMKPVHHWGPTLMHLGCMIEIPANVVIAYLVGSHLWGPNTLLYTDTYGHKIPLFGFYGISIIVGYLMPYPIYTYILFIYFTNIYIIYLHYIFYIYIIYITYILFIHIY